MMVPTVGVAEDTGKEGWPRPATPPADGRLRRMLRRPSHPHSDGRGLASSWGLRFLTATRPGGTATAGRHPRRITLPRRRSQLARKKNRRKKRRDAATARAEATSLDPADLRSQGWARLQAGDARAALDVFRALQKVDEPAAQLPLYCACQHRARQLRARGLAREAAAMVGNGAVHRRRFDAEGLVGPDWPLFLRYAPAREAVATYVTAANRVATDKAADDGTGSEAVADQVVADQVVVGRCWEQVESLPADYRLRRDVGAVREAVRGETAGAFQWPRGEPTSAGGSGKKTASGGRNVGGELAQPCAPGGHHG